MFGARQGRRRSATSSRGRAASIGPGDTALFDGMRDLGQGTSIVALLPIWGMGSRCWAPVDLDPEHAARALRACCGRGSRCRCTGERWRRLGAKRVWPWLFERPAREFVDGRGGLRPRSRSACSSRERHVTLWTGRSSGDDMAVGVAGARDRRRAILSARWPPIGTPSRSSSAASSARAPSRRLRRYGLVPGIVYGGGKEARAVSGARAAGAHGARRAAAR